MLLALTKVCKDYEVGESTVHALRDVDLEIDEGEFVAIMGPSGSGKSTLMNIMGCLDIPDSGAYSVRGVDVATLDDDELSGFRGRRIGFVFQSFNLLARMTAVENVALPLVYSRDPDALDKAEEALAAVGLAARRDHWPNQMSGGQQQRVAVARALVTRPDLILADEPTGALDSATGEEMMALFARLNGEGNTIVLITHEASIAGYARRRIELRDGRISSDERAS